MAIKSLICEGCGAKIQLDDSRDFGFCEYCGTKVMLKEVIEVRHTGLDPAEKKAENIEKLNDIKLFLEKKDALIARKEAVAVEKKAEQDLFIKKLVGCGIGIIVLICIMHWYVLIPIAAFGGYVGWYYMKNDDYPEFITNQTKKLDELDKEQITVSKQLNDMKYTKELPLGEKYCTVPILGALIGYMKDGRADTIKEAINIYEAAKDKKEMQKMYEEMKKVNQNLANSSNH